MSTEIASSSDNLTFEQFVEWSAASGFISEAFPDRLESFWEKFEKSKILKSVFPKVPEKAQFLIAFQLQRTQRGRQPRIADTFWRLFLQTQASGAIDLDWFDPRDENSDEPFVPDLYAYNGGMSPEMYEEFRKFLKYNSERSRPMYPFARGSAEIFPLLLLQLYDEKTLMEAMQWWIREAQSYEMDVFVRIVEQWYDVKDMAFSWAVETVREYDDEPTTRSRRGR